MIRSAFKLSILPILIFAFEAIFATAQGTTFSWPASNGYYIGVINSKKYTKKKVHDTYALIERDRLKMSDDNTVLRPPHAAEPALRVLEEAYKADVEALNSLNIINEPYWRRLRKKRLDQLSRYFELFKQNILGYQNPKALLDFKGAKTCRDKYAEALVAGGPRLLKVWRQVNIGLRKNNGDPQAIRKSYEEQLKSAEREKFAFEEVIAYGWWNCAVGRVNYIGSEKAMENQFRRLFTKVKRKWYPRVDVDDYEPPSF